MINFKKKSFLFIFTLLFNFVFANNIVLANYIGVSTEAPGCSPGIICTCQPNVRFSEVCGMENGVCKFTSDCSANTKEECLNKIKLEYLISNENGETRESYSGCSWRDASESNVSGNIFNDSLPNPMAANSINQLIGKIINSIMGVVGSLALLMFVYGGIIWMTAAGSDERVKKGKNILIWSVLGLVVVFIAYGLTKFIINLVA